MNHSSLMPGDVLLSHGGGGIISWILRWGQRKRWKGYGRDGVVPTHALIWAGEGWAIEAHWGEGRWKGGVRMISEESLMGREGVSYSVWRKEDSEEGGEAVVKAFGLLMEGQKYDYWGLISVGLWTWMRRGRGVSFHQRGAVFCSELVGRCYGHVSPQDLAPVDLPEGLGLRNYGVMRETGVSEIGYNRHSALCSLM